MGKYESRKRRTVSSRAFVVLLALVLILGVAAGSTVAWLVAKTDPVVNTFTYGDINITLTETKPANQQAKIIPGVDIEKDPKVTVVGGSEDCYLFVKVVEEGTFVSGKVTYSVDTGWTQGNGTDIPADVYYRVVTASDTNQVFNVLKDNKVIVSSDLTKAEIENLDDATLTFTAYAVQKDGIDTAAAAWAKIA